jgi:hypothetical protein
VPTAPPWKKTTPVADWRAQEARNETIFREMNEWTEEDNDARPGPRSGTDVYLCECSDRRCTDPITLTRLEYEAVRAVPVCFAIAVNHENPEIDLVTSENDRFATVEKFYGIGARIARESDPRR